MTGYRSPLLRSLQQAIASETEREAALTLRAAVLQAAEFSRTDMLRELKCSDDELRQALARLARVKDEHVDLKALMEEPANG